MTEESRDEVPKETGEVHFLVPKLLKKKPSVANSSSDVKSTIKKISSLITPTTDNYMSPSWAEIPESSDHVIEVMNNGVVQARHKLKSLAKKGYITIGRMDTCDIQTNIPGASRLHCYLQYGDGFDGRGWYVFDKASTQGTFVNKKEVPKGIYYKARAGSVIQITKSNFHLFLEGNDEQEQPQPSTTTPVMEEPRLESLQTNFLDELKAKTERSFEKDPTTMLSKFCEREGIEFKFSKLTGDEKSKSYTYAFDLPDDVSSGNGGSFTGSGADAGAAQQNCALQVCRHLNELNLLTLDPQRNERKNMEANEFYEEDEDTFYDRTGQIEKQRLKRIERQKATYGIKEKAMTYDELLKKLKQLEEDRTAVSDQLDRIMKPLDGSKLHPDEIDVVGLKASLSVRLEISKLKNKHKQLVDEIRVMQKAADIAKPTEFRMPISARPSKSTDATSESVQSLSDSTKHQDPAASEDESLPVTSDETPQTSSKEALAVPNSSSANEHKIVRGPTMPHKVEEPPPAEKKFGLLTRKDLQMQKNAALNKRKMAEDLVDEVREEKRNRSDEFEDPTDVVDWVAPAGQTGDGRTKLNDKFGGRY